MSKPIVLTTKQWRHLRARLSNDYSPSVMMMTFKMKETLGFTVRHYAEWTAQRGSMADVRLDFYNEPKRTMFLLKYGEYLGNDISNTIDIQ